jgi:hypothetical protein
VLNHPVLQAWNDLSGWQHVTQNKVRRCEPVHHLGIGGADLFSYVSDHMVS